MLLFDVNEWFKSSKATRSCLLVCIFLTYAKQVESDWTKLYYAVGHANTEQYGRSLMRYCDIDAPIYDHDEFMDRIVGISYFPGNIPEYHYGKVVTTGIFIKDDHVLTSYNPFRNLIHSIPRHKMYIQFLFGKWFHGSRGYVIEREPFSCARQVLPLMKNEITEEQWHGSKHTHSPVHDLMLIKIANKMKFVEKPYEFREFMYGTNLLVNVTGPLRTELAKENEELPETIKFVSLGMIDYRHILSRNHLHTVELKRDEAILEDCDEWFPRSWGYFFCIQNVEDYIALGSGAFLFGNAKVFGVGSFSLQKGKQSIFVFTDVRHYLEVIQLPCNYDASSFTKRTEP